MKIIGVVSGYLTDNKIIETPFGDIVNAENSGIVLSYGAKHVYEIINDNRCQNKGIIAKGFLEKKRY
ncbi:MAG TPA: hypothetical protein VK609_07050 [Mucilaginibacter sp.]|nr:hypothetical protein [Mucilaginibacter sp.]